MRRLAFGLVAGLAVLLCAPASPGHHAFDTTWFMDSTEKIKVKRLGKRVRNYTNVSVFFAANAGWVIDYGSFEFGGATVHKNKRGTKFEMQPNGDARATQINYLEAVIENGAEFFDEDGTEVTITELDWTITGKVNRAGTKIKIVSKAKAAGVADDGFFQDASRGTFKETYVVPHN